MGKSGGQGKGKPKLKDRSFGKALAKTTIQGRGEISLGKKSGGNLVSVIDNSALDDFVLNAEMDARGAEVKRVHKNDVYLVQPTVSATVQSMSTQAFDYTHLEIPRKPAWTRDMTAEEVDRREKDSFLDWRRSIAGIENTNTTLKVTPFEKNIEVWRQLWRVVERSDFVVQVVDARNPLLYYTDDLKKYTSEHKPARPMMLLVNKADYLTDYQRLAWAKKFESLDIKFAFYSAKSEQDVIDEREHQRVSGLVDDKHSFDEQEDDDLQDMQALADDLAAEAIVTEDTMDNVVNALKKSTISTSDVDQKGSSTENASEIVWGDGALESTATKPTSRTAGASFVTSNERWRLRAQVLTRKQLILLLTLLPQKLSIAPQERHVNRICAGMVGYPNVGKSSVINTILGVSKSTHGQVRVAVSSTPGKTKHFQTLNVTNDLMLCDCPGLVFPSFMRSTGEMLCAGILPIHQMRDYVSAAQVLASRVPLHLLEAQYGMRIRRQLDIKDHPDRPPTASEVLCAYCAVKGYITNGTGRWDEFRACRDLLKDFNDGRILFVAPPVVRSEALRINEGSGGKAMGSDDAVDEANTIDMDKWLAETEKTVLRQERVAERAAVNALKQAQEEARIAEEEAEELMRNPESSNMVFGGMDECDWENGDDTDDDNDDDDDDNDDDDDDVEKETPCAVKTDAKAAPTTAIINGIEYTFADDSSSEEEGGDGEVATEESVSLAQSDTASIVSGMTGMGTRGGYGAAMGVEKEKREHKRLRHWGKKNKKLRDKDPYGEENGVISYVAYSTNRSRVAGGAGNASSAASVTSSVGSSLSKQKDQNKRRHDPRVPYGTQFVRSEPTHTLTATSEPRS